MFSSLEALQTLSPHKKYLKTPKIDAQIQDLSEDLSLSEGLSLSLSLRNFYDRSSCQVNRVMEFPDGWNCQG